MVYKIFYYMMLVGYLGVAIQVPGLKMKIIGILLVIVNGLIFLK